MKTMIYIRLLVTFIKIGLFSFGGGYAMIPLIQKEIESYNWLSSSEFADIIAISEVTPGPIAVNSATFVGYKAAGVLGGLVATIGVSIPSLVIIMIVSRFFFGYQKHPLNMMVFYGIRPVIVGLVATAAVSVAETAIFNSGISWSSVIEKGMNMINFGGMFIFAAALIALIKFKVHPILVIVASGIAGVLMF